VANIVRLKKRHRYIGFSLKSDNNISKASFINEIKKQCKLKLEQDSSKIGLRLIKFDEKFGIIKCNHLQKENVIKLLNSIKKIGNYEVDICTIATSGTVRSLIKKYLKNNLKI